MKPVLIPITRERIQEIYIYIINDNKKIFDIINAVVLILLLQDQFGWGKEI